MKRNKEEKKTRQAEVEKELDELIMLVKNKKSALKKMSRAIQSNRPEKQNK
jgi:hypothetical protein